MVGKRAVAGPLQYRRRVCPPAGENVAALHGEVGHVVEDRVALERVGLSLERLEPHLYAPLELLLPRPNEGVAVRRSTFVGRLSRILSLTLGRRTSPPSERDGITTRGHLLFC